jgi:hypothetical protein
MGAQEHLICYHIPLRFFVSAAVFHVVAWLLLVVGHADVTGYTGGPGIVLAALHSLTLGVLVMVAMGASYQLLNVATGIASGLAIGGFDISRLSSWLYIPGTVLLVAGMAGGNSHAMLLGGGLVVTAMAAFGLVVGDIFRRTVTLRTTVRHGWAALVCLALLALAGMVLIIDFEHAFLGTPLWPDRSDLAIGHAILGGFGFMGLLVLGFSNILVPMFALSAAPDERHSRLSFGLVLVALVVAVPAALAGNAAAMILAAASGLAGVAVHLSLMLKALREGMKKRLGLSFVMVRGAWFMLPLSIVLGALAAGRSDDLNLPSLFIFILFFGWLLTFMTGILQRILPFLASMHGHKQGKRGPRLSEMGNQNITLKLHAACHGAALVLVSIGILSDVDALVLAGGLTGSVGAAAFLWFALGVSRLVMSFYKEDKLLK